MGGPSRAHKPSEIERRRESSLYSRVYVANKADFEMAREFKRGDILGLIARWLLNRGMNVDESATVDRDGFGGHTALFGTIVSQANFGGKYPDAPFTRLLLDHGANSNARASLRKRLHPGYEIDGMHEYRDVTPVGWGKQFIFKDLVNPEGMRLIAERGGLE